MNVYVLSTTDASPDGNRMYATIPVSDRWFDDVDHALIESFFKTEAVIVFNRLIEERHGVRDALDQNDWTLEPWTSPGPEFLVEDDAESTRSYILKPRPRMRG